MWELKNKFAIFWVDIIYKSYPPYTWLPVEFILNVYISFKLSMDKISQSFFKNTPLYQYVVHHNPIPSRLISTSNTLGGNHSTLNFTINPPVSHSTIDQSPEYRKLSVENNPQRDITYGRIDEKCIFLQVTLRCRYNAVNFHRHIYKRHPIARPVGRVWGVCYEFQVWFMFCCYNRSAVCNIVIIEPRYNGTWV